MHVDRSRFLLLTASLALAACGDTKPKTPSEGKDAKTDAKAGEAKAGDASPSKTEPSTPDTATPPGGKPSSTGPAPADPLSPANEGEGPSPVNES